MRVVAVDPGYGRIGIAVLEKIDGQSSLLFSACIVTDKKNEFVARLNHLGKEFENIVNSWTPTVCAIEKLFFAKNQKTAMQVSEARGVLIDRGAKMGLKVKEFTPLEVKIAVTGYGIAGKGQIKDMVKKLVKITHLPKYDDEYDAIAIGLTCLATIHSP